MAGLVVDRSELLGALPGDFDFDMALVGGERRVEAGLLPVSEMLLAGTQDVSWTALDGLPSVRLHDV